MKYAIFAVILAIFGLAEYAFVEYYPLSPQHRIQKVQKLPIVRSFVKAADVREIRKAIEKSDSGYVSVTRNGERRKWDDANVLYEDFKEHDRAAVRMVYQIRNIERMGPRVDETRRHAEEGDPFAMMQLYTLGKYQTGEKDMKRAIELLEEDESGFTKSYFYQNMVSSIPWNSRERMLLHARVMQENYRFPGQDDAAYAQMTLQNEKGLAKLKKAAAAGVPDAVWIVKQLAVDGTEVRLSK